MFFLFFAILICVIILFTLIKNKLLALKIASIVSLSSGILVLFVGYLSKIIIEANVNVINTNKIVNLILNKFLISSAIFLIISIIIYLIYVLLKRKKASKKI